MSTSPTQLPPIVTPIVDPKTGLPSLPEYTWRQLLLQGRSAWTPYTPTIAHLSAITTNDCAFCQLGKLIIVRIGLTGTTDGTALTVTLPFKAKSALQAFAAAMNGSLAGMATLNSGDFLTLTINKYDGTTQGNGSVVTWSVEGAYEAQ